MELTTPALLFPAISLLLLAYTNRFVVLAQLVRGLHKNREDKRNSTLIRQIANLRLRLNLIRRMQLFGVGAFFLCTASMFSLFLGAQKSGEIVFALSLISLMTSLAISLYEVYISTRALRYELSDMEVGASL